MKVVESLAHYLFCRGLVSSEDLAELRRRGFLPPEDLYERDHRDFWEDREPEWWEEFAGEAHPRAPEDGTRPAAKPRSGGKRRRSAPSLPELEASLRGLLPSLEAGVARLRPLAGELGAGPEPSDWPRQLQSAAAERFEEAIRETLAGGRLKFDDLWCVVSEDRWHNLRPSQPPGGPAWSAWRALVTSPDGRVATAYRWILRSDPASRVFHCMQLQRTLVRAVAAVFRDDPDVLWRAVTRPFHEAGFLALSFSYTAEANRSRGVPIRAAFQADLPERPCFALGADDRVAIATPGGGVRVSRAGGVPVKVLDEAPGRIEALAFHPGGDLLYISRTDETGLNRVIEVELATGRDRFLLEAYAAAQGPVLLTLRNSLLCYRPAGIDGFRFFRRDVPGSCGFISSPYPIHASDDFAFLPGSRYFSATVCRASGALQYRIWDWSEGTLAGMFEASSNRENPNEVLTYNNPRCSMAYCTRQYSEVYETRGLTLAAREEHSAIGDPRHWFCACFSPDGRWLVKWTVGGDIRAWDWNSGAAAVTMEPSVGAPPLAGLAIDGNFAAGFRQSDNTGGEDRIDIWNLETGRLLPPAYCRQLHADNRWIWTAQGKLALLRCRRNSAAEAERGSSGAQSQTDPRYDVLLLEIWQPFPHGERRELRLTRPELPGEFIDIWTPPDQDVATLRFRTAEGALELLEFDVSHEKVTSRRTLVIPFQTTGCNFLDLDLGTGRQLDFYHPHTGEMLDRWQIQAHTRPATSLRVAKSGDVLAVCCDGQSLVLVDLKSGAQPVEALLPAAAGPHRMFAVSAVSAADAEILIGSGSVLKSVRVSAEGIETRFERQLHPSGGSGDAVFWSAAAPATEPRAAFGSHGQLELLHRPDSEIVPFFLHANDGGADWVPAFSPCGGILTAARKGELRVWTAGGRALHRRLFSCQQPFAAEYSPGGDAIWVGDADGAFWKIEVANLQPPAGASVPAWDLPGRETFLRAWTLAQRMGGIEPGDWLPILAAVCTEGGAASRTAYSDLGLFAPSIWAE